MGRSAEIPLDRYDTDKIAHGYLSWYDTPFAPLVDKPVALLELGVLKGGSLLMWRDYFPRGTIVGIDLSLPGDFEPPDRVRLFQGDQTDRAFLSAAASAAAPGGFDIIIDDASHLGEPTRIAFWHLFDHHLKPGGLYAIEDWGTGYWADWPDGRRLRSKSPGPGSRAGRLLRRAARAAGWKIPRPGHGHGMVGFVKQLIDEQGAAAATRGRSAGKSERGSRFASVLITPAIVFVRKA